MAEPDAPIVSETKPTEPLAPASNAVTPPTEDNDERARVEALEAQLKKLEMERNLLRKKVDSTSKETDTNLNKALEEKEDYRSIAERALTQLEELQKEKTETETKQARETATNEVFGEFDPKVVEVAKKTGLTVTEDSEDAREALKTKLQDLAQTIGVTSTPKVIGSNPAPTSPAVEDTSNQNYKPIIKSFGADLVQNRSAVATNAINASQHLKQLDSIQAMKVVAGVASKDTVKNPSLLP